MLGSMNKADARTALPTDSAWNGLRGLIFCLFFLLCAVGFTRILFSSTTQAPAASLERLTDMSAARPFQYRVLVPLLVRGVMLLSPDSPLRELYFVMTIGFVLMLLLAFSLYLGRYYPERIAIPGALLILYPMFWNYCLLGPFYYPSDIPAAMLFVFGLLAIDTRRTAAYYAVFALACLNRETACFLTAAFLLHEVPGRAWRRLGAHAVAQGLIWVGIKAALLYAFRDHGGAVVYEHHLASNIRHILDLRTNGAVCTAFAFGLVWMLIPLGWARVPPPQKRLLLIVPPFLLVMALVGNLWETRIYNELIPLLTAPALAAFLGTQANTAGDQPPRRPL